MQGLKLGTRGSPLALAQARKVAAAIEAAQRWPEGYVELVTVTTTGDKVQDRPLSEIGGKALWTKELDKALLAGELSFCVHSMKDVESVRPKDIHIAAVRPRGDVRDRLIGAELIDALKKGAVVGTSSRRRAAQLLRLRPDLKIVPLRGNVETRINKVQSGEIDATLLASAGLKRLGIEIGTSIPAEILLPAPAQAVIGMECRTNDTGTQSVLTTVNNAITYACVMAERAFTRALGATCASPVAAFAVLEDGDLRMRAQLFSEDGSEMVEQRAVFDCGDDKTPAEPCARDAGQGARVDPEAVRGRMRRVVVLRPEPGASETVARAAARGLDAVAIPLFRIEPLDWQAPDAGAVRCPAVDQRQRRAIRRTRAGSIARASGSRGRRGDRRRGACMRVRCRQRRRYRCGAAPWLARPEASALHLAGEDRGRSTSRPIEAIAVYRSRAIEAPEDLKTAEEAVVLVHSPRAGSASPMPRPARARSRLDPHRRDQRGCGGGCRHRLECIEAAAHPTDDALLALAGRLCEKDRGE